MYILMKWNRQYGKSARFIVKDKSTNKYALFTPDRLTDIAWVDQDLTQFPEYKNWDDFEHTEIDYLENVIM